MTPDRIGARLQRRASEAQHHLVTRFGGPIQVVAEARERCRAFVPSLVSAFGRIAPDRPCDAAERILSRARSQREDAVLVDPQSATVANCSARNSRRLIGKAHLRFSGGESDNELRVEVRSLAGRARWLKIRSRPSGSMKAGRRKPV